MSKLCSKCKKQELSTKSFWCNSCKREYERKRRKERGMKPYRSITHTSDGQKICTKCQDTFPNKRTSSWCSKCAKEAARLERLAKGIQPQIKYDDSPGIKVCRNCKLPQTLDKFYKADSKHSVQGVEAYCIPCRAILYPPDKEKNRLNTASYRKRNRAVYLLNHRVAQARRRGLLVKGQVSNEDAERLYAKTHCRYCKQYIVPEKRTVEHILPLKKGGLHDISNLDMACLSCNCSKRDKTEEEFLTYMRNKDGTLGQSDCGLNIPEQCETDNISA